jgi:hypothetical protein
MRRLDPESALVHLTVGEVHRRAGFARLAQMDYETAVKCADAPLEAALGLAAHHERAGEFDRARVLLSKIAPDHPRRLLIHARLNRRNDDSAGAEACLQKLLRMGSVENDVRAEALGELALIQDAQGDFDAAFATVCEAKAIHLAHCGAEVQASHHVTHRFARMVDSIRPENFAEWARFAPPPEGDPRPVLLTGFPRSGTTLLEQVLDAHPAICSSEEIDLISREIFPRLHGEQSGQACVCSVLDALSPKQICAQRRSYWRTMAQLRGEPLSGEIHIDKNPAYNLLIPVFFRLFPEARFLIAIRDPRDVVLSCFLRYLPLNPVSVTFLTPESTAQRYALDMTAWLRFSDMMEAPWIEVRYEAMVADFVVQARNVCSFLDVPWHDNILGYREAIAGKTIGSPTYADVKQPIYHRSMERWRNYEKHLAPQFEALQRFCEAFGYTS